MKLTPNKDTFLVLHGIHPSLWPHWVNRMEDLVSQDLYFEMDTIPNVDPSRGEHRHPLRHIPSGIAPTNRRHTTVNRGVRMDEIRSHNREQQSKPHNMTTE